MSMHVMWQGVCRRWPRYLLAILTILSASAAWAGSPVNTGYFDNVAIMGYDPVAYFTDGRATKGSEEFAYDWLGATWQFANAEHQRDLRRHPDPVRAAIRRVMRLGRGQG